MSTFLRVAQFCVRSFSEHCIIDAFNQMLNGRGIPPYNRARRTLGTAPGGLSMKLALTTLTTK